MTSVRRRGRQEAPVSTTSRTQADRRPRHVAMPKSIHMNTVTTSELRPILWKGDSVSLIDQTRLPHEEIWLEYSDFRDVILAIKNMQIRGAPAIGVAGAYALALAASEFAANSRADFESSVNAAAKEIGGARPTGANLAWAVDRMMAVMQSSIAPAKMADKLAREACLIQKEDEEANRRMGRYGADLLPHGGAVMTHCNAGALATGGFGTALGVIRTAWEDCKISHVYANETRPLMQGARLTAWELVKAGIDATVLPDSAAGQLMRRGKVQAIVVGADRIAANGDVANKIGTYSLAVLARENGVPFYVAAPTNTVDMELATGDAIPIEERSPEEVTHIAGHRVTPDGIGILNTAFDVTPNRYVSAIITENGVARKPYEKGLKRLMEGDVARG